MRHHVRRFAVASLAVCAGLIASVAVAEASCVPSELESKLSQIRSQFGPIKVISTFRKGATIAGSGKPSYHASCRAVDFVPPPGKYGAVAAWLNANHSGGVGTYSSGHIHIDNGPHVRFSRGWSGDSGTRVASKSRRTRTASAHRGERAAYKTASLSRGKSAGKSKAVADSGWAERIARNR